MARMWHAAWGEPIHPDTVSSLMTTVINTHNNKQGGSSITLRVYAHVISDQLTEAADIFARAVAGAS